MKKICMNCGNIGVEYKANETFDISCYQSPDIPGAASKISGKTIKNESKPIGRCDKVIGTAECRPCWSYLAAIENRLKLWSFIAVYPH